MRAKQKKTRKALCNVHMAELVTDVPAFLTREPGELCALLLPLFAASDFRALAHYEGCREDIVRAALCVLRRTSGYIGSLQEFIETSPSMSFSEAFDLVRRKTEVVATCADAYGFCSVCGGRLPEVHTECSFVSVLGTRWVYVVGFGQCMERFVHDIETVQRRITVL